MSGWWRSFARGRLREHLLVLAGLVVFVGAVYVAVVIVMGVLGGGSGRAPASCCRWPPRRPSRWGSNLCEAGCGRGRTAYPVAAHPLPYEVLAHFAPGSGASAQETPVWMAKVLAPGVGARRVQVWPLAGGRLRLAAVHPDSDGGVAGAT